MSGLKKRFKTGGRAKGTPNKTTQELRELLTRLLSESMEEDVRNMTPIERAKLYRYILPPIPYEVENDHLNSICIVIDDKI